MKEIHVFEYTGDFAENKDIARKLRIGEIEPEIKNGKKVIIDFNQVNSATQSFVHALLSQVIRDYGPDILLEKLLFRNCNSKIKTVIKIVAEYVQDGIYTEPEEGGS